jgi:hypothetical protein
MQQPSNNTSMQQPSNNNSNLVYNFLQSWIKEWQRHWLHKSSQQCCENFLLGDSAFL